MPLITPKKLEMIALAQIQVQDQSAQVQLQSLTNVFLFVDQTKDMIEQQSCAFVQNETSDNLKFQIHSLALNVL